MCVFSVAAGFPGWSRKTALTVTQVLLVENHLLRPGGRKGKSLKSSLERAARGMQVDASCARRARPSGKAAREGTAASANLDAS